MVDKFGKDQEEMRKLVMSNFFVSYVMSCFEIVVKLARSGQTYTLDTSRLGCKWNKSLKSELILKGNLPKNRDDVTVRCYCYPTLKLDDRICKKGEVLVQLLQ